MGSPGWEVEGRLGLRVRGLRSKAVGFGPEGIIQGGWLESFGFGVRV